MSIRLQVTKMVADVMKTIKRSERLGQDFAKVDLSNCPSLSVGSVMLTTLAGMGYIAFIVLPGGKDEETCERLYVDIKRRRDEGKIAVS